MYLQHHWHGSQQSTDKAKNILFYALWVLYTLSAVTGVADMLAVSWRDASLEIVHQLGIIQVVAFACCDFIAQFILIYRCWIMWGYNIRVVIVPSLSAFAFLAIWMAAGTPEWVSTLEVTGLALSMTVNTLVTGLIVFRILKVFQEVKTRDADNQILGVTGGRTLQRVIFILIESGMALFSIQLARLVVIVVLESHSAASEAFYFIIGIHEMLNGITPTIILVRVSMGLSFHNESSMVEASIGSLRFAPDNPNPIPETGSINILDEERRDDETELSNDSDIQMVER